MPGTVFKCFTCINYFTEIVQCISLGIPVYKGETEYREGRIRPGSREQLRAALSSSWQSWLQKFAKGSTTCCLAPRSKCTPRVPALWRCSVLGTIFTRWNLALPTGGTSLIKDGNNSRRTLDYSHKSLSAGVSIGKAVKAVGGMCAVQTRVPEFESPTHMAYQA